MDIDNVSSPIFVPRTIPKVFHQIWIGSKPFPAEFEQYRNSWKKHHPDWKFKVWDTDAVENLHIINHREFSKASRPAQKADILRYEIIWRFGGVYLDTDFEALRNIEPLLEGVSFFTASEEPKVMSIGIIGATAGHALAWKLIEELPKSFLEERYRGVSHQTGPGFFTRTLKDSSITNFSSKLFYPVPFKQQSGQIYSLDDAFAVHHWSHSWKQTPLINTLAEESPSFFCQAFKRLTESCRKYRNATYAYTISQVQTLLFLWTKIRVKLMRKLSRSRSWEVQLNNLSKQFGENVSVLQIGAMDGISFDPIAEWIQKFNWQSLAVEPLTDKYNLLKQNYSSYPKVTTVCCAITTSNGIIEMFRVDPEAVAMKELPGWVNGISSIHNSRNALGGHGCKTEEYEAIKEDIITVKSQGVILPNLLDSFGVNQIDVVVIDTEGHDYLILKQFDFKKYSPKLVRIEFSNLSLSDQYECLRIFKRFGYCFHIEEEDLVAHQV